MTITLTANEYDASRHAIQEGVLGEMLRIMRIKHIKTGEIEHVIFPAINRVEPSLSGGWPFSSGRSYHGSEINGQWEKTGLGTFYLIRKTDTNDGGCVLEFTDDMNPDLP
jgi:hypothetical protein